MEQLYQIQIQNRINRLQNHFTQAFRPNVGIPRIIEAHPREEQDNCDAKRNDKMKNNRLELVRSAVIVLLQSIQTQHSQRTEYETDGH